MKIITILIITIFFIGNTQAINYTNDIRQSRLNWCIQAYGDYKEHIQANYIHTNQDIIARCFAYSSLIYAYESWYWQSPRCKNHFNCYGIKNPTYKWGLKNINYTITNWRFLIFNNHQENDLVFARYYYKFHMNKTADTLIRWVWRNWQRVWAWSLTDQDTYVNFISSNFWEFYNIWLNMK